MIKFSSEGHKYESILPNGVKWTGVTTLVGSLKQPFDQIEKAAKCSVRKPGRYQNKWYGLSPVEILDAWSNESKRSTDLGHWYHSKREQELYEPDMQLMWGVQPPIIENGIKIARDQKLDIGIYPEHLCYLQSVGICGQADYVQVTPTHKLNIRDYKTNKEIKTKGFTNWEGITTKMLKPVHHLDECEFNSYALQLSLYAYIILRHNSLLTLGELTIEHVEFELAGEDKYGYPITRLDDNNEPMVKNVKMIQIPYMLKEVQSIIIWLKSK